MIKDSLAYTGNELDDILERYYQEGDWVQLRKGFRHKGFGRKKMYQIKDVYYKDGLFVRLIDDKGKERKVCLSKLKYITIQQREYASKRVEFKSVNL